MDRTQFQSSQVLETPVPSAPQNASGNSGPLSGYGPFKTIRAQLNVSAVSGSSPTLNVVIEDTLDGTNWNTVGTFTQMTATGNQVINVTGQFADRLRIRWTIGGTGGPQFTFSVNWSLSI